MAEARKRYTNRRTFIKGLGATGVIGISGLAGCSEDTGNGTGGGNGGGGGGGGGNGGGGGGGSTGGSGSVTLRISSFLAEGNTLWAAQIPQFQSRLQEVADRDVQFEMHPGGALGEPGESLEMIEGDVADLSFIPTSYFSETFQLSSIVELPGWYAELDTRDLTPAYRSIAVDGILAEEEYDQIGVKPIITVMSPHFQLIHNGSPLTSVDDFDGMSIRGTGGIMNVMLEHLGATAVSVPGPDMYPGLERGTFDGLITHPPALVDFNLQEVTDSVTRNGAFGNPTNTFMMDLEQFNSYSDDFQSALLEAGAHASETGAQGLYERSQEAYDTVFPDAGMNIYDIEGEFDASLDAEIQDVREQWVSDLGGPASDISDAYDQALQEYL